MLAGLKTTVTGDTLVSSSAVAKAVEGQPLRGPTVPEPVVFCSMDPPSLSQVKDFERGLENLCREDPSLRVSQGDVIHNMCPHR